MASTRYYVTRVGQAIFTILVVSTLAFFMMRELPGGPVAYIRAQLVASGQQLSPARLQRLTEAYTNIVPNEPIYIQYIDYMKGLFFHFNLGQSYWYNGQQVSEILLQAMPWTIYYSALALFGGFAFNVLMGSVMAYKQSSRFDTTATISFLSLGSVPFYVVAILLVYFLGFQLGWFPSGGAYNRSVTEPGFNWPFLRSVLYHSALPIAAMFLTRTAGAIGMRANAIRVLGADYLRVARLRGLSEGRISTRYVARNAMLPSYTSLLIGIGTLFGGAVILEQIFAYPGVGFYTFQALKAKDYPLLMGSFVLTTGATVLGILIGDLTYGLIDPRAGGGDRESF